MPKKYDRLQPNRNRRSTGTAQRRNKKLSPGVIIPVFILVVLLIVAGYIAAYKFMPNFATEGPFTYYENLKEDEINIVMGDEIIKLNNYPDNKNKYSQLFLPVDYVKEYLDKYICWDEAANQLIITTETQVMRFTPDDVNYTVNNRPMTMDTPVINVDGLAYLPIDLLTELYNVEIEYLDLYSIVIVDEKAKEKTVAKTSKEATMRYEPDSKSAIEAKLEKDEDIVVFEETEDYTKVRNKDGLIGYIPTKDIGEKTVIEAEAPPMAEPALLPEIEGNLVLLWEQVTSYAASSSVERQTPIEGVNVLSPTWFEFDEETMNGDIVSIASKDYVDWAHSNGYQVWPLISDNYNVDINNAVLSNADTREHVINQIMGFIDEYDLDGINIDFERLQPENSENFTYFLRELKPLMAEQGALLSVDVYVPMYTPQYNREDIGKTVDYFCVMTYDEHTSGSPTSGPVASLGFVEQGIIDTLEDVPKEKLLMGLPFYTRVWKEVTLPDGTIEKEIDNYSMDYAYEFFVRNGAEFVWMEDIGSYYAEFVGVDKEDGVEKTFKAWFEDPRSIEEKLKLAEKYDLAGVACWKKGLENDDVWASIGDYQADAGDGSGE